jgi:hypothetical protein
MLKTNTGLRLDERALLVKLTISNWTASKTDKEVTDIVIDDNNAQSGAGRFTKRLFGKAALRNISQAVGAARVAHRTLTLPWEDNGNRIITTEGYQHYSKTMRHYRGVMEENVRAFIDDYDGYIGQAREELGKMFRRDDYPTAEEAKRKFHFDVEPSPIPTSADFRAKVSDKEAAYIAKDIERRQKQRLDAAMKDVWKRIADVTEKMATRLSEYKGPTRGYAVESGPSFKSSLVTNIVELADVLPTLNINNDPELTRLHKRMVEELTQYDADELKFDEKKRARTAKAARQIYSKVSKFL